MGRSPESGPESGGESSPEKSVEAEGFGDSSSSTFLSEEEFAVTIHADLPQQLFFQYGFDYDHIVVGAELDLMSAEDDDKPNERLMRVRITGVRSNNVPTGVDNAYPGKFFEAKVIDRPRPRSEWLRDGDPEGPDVYGIAFESLPGGMLVDAGWDSAYFNRLFVLGLAGAMYRHDPAEDLIPTKA